MHALFGTVWYNNGCSKWTNRYRGEKMSQSMMNMWISLAGMGLLIIAIGLIVLARHKLKGFLSIIVSFLAYVCLILGGIIILYIVFSGPTI